MTANGALLKVKLCLFTTLSLIADAISKHGQLFLCDDFRATLLVYGVLLKNRCSEACDNTKMLRSFIERHGMLVPMHM